MRFPLPPALIPGISRTSTTIDARSTGEADTFTGRLLGIMETVLSEGVRQPLTLGIHRSDYMIDRGADARGSPQLRQIEINTISSSFAALSARVTEVHRYVLQRFAPTMPAVAAYVGSSDGTRVAAASVPPNDALRAIPAAIAAAHRAYGGDSRR